MIINNQIYQDLHRLTRVAAMLLNRSTMYNIDHPYVNQSIDSFYFTVEPILKSTSPVVLMMIRDQFYIDEVPFDRGGNVQRIISHFKKLGVQSISFESGLGRNEIRTFLEVFTSTDTYPGADAMKSALGLKGVRHVRINHVLFRKVTEDDEVIARDALKNLTPAVSDEEQSKSKKLLVNLVLESLLGEELRETITMEKLLRNPAGLSKTMTETDLESSRRGDVQGGHPGLVLVHEIEYLGEQIGKTLQEAWTADLHSMAAALFEMKQRLLEGIETQKSLNVTYPNEETIVARVNEITDGVVLRIVRDEYDAGKSTTARVAQIVRRLVPDIRELKRLMPGIRAALIEEGMPLAEYLLFVQALGKELQSEELAGILQESAEEIGLDGETLIEEIKKNPGRAAELIVLASEIRRGSGDEQALVDLLVDYVERLGVKLTTDDAQRDGEVGEQHLRRIISSLESSILGRLRKVDLKSDLLERLEERFNKRMDDILEKVKLDWLRSHSAALSKDFRKDLSVLQLLEQGVGENDDLAEILETVRTKVRAGEMDENDFGQIYAEIGRQQASRAAGKKQRMPTGILDMPDLRLILEKEIARARRYGIPFSTLSFSLVRVLPATSGAPGKVSFQLLVAAILEQMATIARDADIVGELGRNRFVVLLPMTGDGNARSALARCLRLLHETCLDIDGMPLKVRVAGVVTSYDLIATPNVDAFVETLTNRLAQMERRIRNLQVYF